MKTTGRKFKCVGQTEINEVAWSNYFKIGQTYKEHFIHNDSYQTLELIDNGYPPLSWRVDASQFELVEE